MQARFGDGYLSPGGSEELRVMLRGLDLSGARALDFGCGVGGASIEMLREYGVDHVVAVDVQAPMIEQARGRAAAHGVLARIDFRVIGAESARLADAGGSFDFVLAKDVLNSVPDRIACCREILRILRPGGVLATADWCIGKSVAGGLRERYVELLAAGGLRSTWRTVDQNGAMMIDAGFASFNQHDHTSDAILDARRQLVVAETETRRATSVNPDASTLERRDELTRTRLKALESGEIQHWHLTARKAGAGEG